MNQYFIKRAACPCCNSAHINEVYRKNYLSFKEYLDGLYNHQGGIDYAYLQDQDYVLEQCSNCDHLFQSEIADNEVMKKLYEQWIDPQKSYQYYESDKSVEYFQAHANAIAMYTRLFTKSPRKLTFLDYSIGWGNWAKLAKGFGLTVYGTEFNQYQIRHAKKEAITIIEENDLANHRFDFINLEQVCEHIPDPISTLKLLSTCLNKNGIINVHVPNATGISNKLESITWQPGTQHLLMPIQPLEHINCFNLKSMTALGNQCGLKIIDVNERLGHVPTLKEKTIKNFKNKLRPFYYRLKGYAQVPEDQVLGVMFEKV